MVKNFICISIILANFLFAQAFKNPPESSSSISQSGAFIAQADDASAINFNPAGLVQLKNGEFLFGLTYIHSTTKYFYSNGVEEKKYSPGFLPYFYYVPNIENENFKFGIGVNIPYGQTIEWSREIVRYWNYQIPYYTRMQTINISPAVSFKLNQSFSVGMAPNIYYSKLNIHNLILLAPGIETIGKMEVDGYTFGGTFGLLYRKNNYSIGVKYQTPFEIRYKGNFDLHNIGSFNAETKINFPKRYGIGVCFYPVEKIKMEFDVEHFKFSSLKSIFINPGFISPYEVQKNWKDVYNFYFGTEYRKSKNLKIRGGIAKLNSPIPESTWEPSLPDADTIILTGGTEIKTRFGFFEFTILISNPKEIKKEDRNYGGNFKSEGFFFTIGFKREF